ncbi:MAG: hemK [Chloroflexi bacterium]|nr:hemK [Chloroflexota bacterium]
METVSHRLKEITDILTSASETPALDAQVLLAYILEKPRAWLLAYPEAEISPKQEKQLLQTVQRLQNGEPLPYILGDWEFFGLDFIVTPAVLIPRPETELLIEQALEWLRSRPSAHIAADIGTGSGCIAVSLAVHAFNLHFLATDLSLAALEIARLNARRHKVADQIDFLQADLLKPLNVERLTDTNNPLTDTNNPLADRIYPPTFNLITANLPYIPTSTLLDLAVYGREPSQALDGGPDGLGLIRRLLADAPRVLAPGGLLLLEIEYRQGPIAKLLAQNAFPYANVSVIPDLAGHDRLVRIEI